MVSHLLALRDLLVKTTTCLRQIETDLRAVRQLLTHEHVSRLAALPPEDSLRLTGHTFGTFSQTHEDGVIAEIFRRIGTTNKKFVEIGVGNGLENNTANLLLQDWTGVWLEGDPNSIRSIEASHRRFISTGKLVVKQSFVTAENVEETFARTGSPIELDLLSIDIDRNTYWIWKALSNLKPRVVVIEYNAAFAPQVEWVVPYHADKSWDGTLQFGASLKAFERLGSDLGYSLVGCDLAGVNAFFVRTELTKDRFSEPFTAEHHYQPPRYYLSCIRSAHPPGVDDALERAE